MEADRLMRTSWSSVLIAAATLLAAVPALAWTPAAPVAMTGEDSLDPVGMNCLAVGGTAIGQAPGVRDGEGLNNMGLLVRVAGRVTLVVSSSVYVDDGSNIADMTGRTGVMLRCPGPADVAEGSIVSAAGVIEGSIPTGWTTNRRSIRLRDWSDLVVVRR